MSSEDKEINIDMLRIPLAFAPGLKIRFIGREIALRKIVEWAVSVFIIISNTHIY